MTCYICGRKAPTPFTSNSVSICEDCAKAQGINTLLEEEEDSQLDFDFSDEPTNPGIGPRADFAAAEDGAVIQIDRWNLLEALYDEARTIRENLVGNGGAYYVKDRDLTDFFMILDELENL